MTIIVPITENNNLQPIIRALKQRNSKYTLQQINGYFHLKNIEEYILKLFQNNRIKWGILQ